LAERAPHSFTERVRQEIGRLPPEGRCDGRAELAAIIFLAGSIHLRGSDSGSTLRVEITTSSGATARTAFSLLQAEAAALRTSVKKEQDGDRPEIRVHAPHGLRSSSSYVVAVESDVRVIAESIGLLDDEGRPRRAPPPEITEAPCDRLAFARGALLASGSVSAPGRHPHLEIAAPTRELAQRVATHLSEIVAAPVSVSPTAGGFRAVMKSRATIGRLLGEVGATGAFLEWQEHQVRRQVRATATRLANADAANVRRAVDAAGSHVRMVERVVEEVGWENLDPELREIALARLANPEASLAELGALCDPPVGKSAAHRRLGRLAQLTEHDDDLDGSARR
jgi:cell division protein WhiA